MGRGWKKRGIVRKNFVCKMPYFYIRSAEIARSKFLDLEV